FWFFFFQAEDGIRDFHVTGVQTCALPILALIAAEIGHRNPAIFTVFLDWEPYGGLGVSGFRDRHGNPVDDHDLGLDITCYASDIDRKSRRVGKERTSRWTCES